MDADVIVIGLGAFGSAAAAHLARLGARTIGIDTHEPPHAMGSSHGGSRITRLAIGEGDAYVPLVRRSHELWAELATRTGLTLHVTTGGLIMGPGDGRSETHGRRDFVGSTIAVARRHGIAHEVLDAAAIATRFPVFIWAHGDGPEDGFYGFPAITGPTALPTVKLAGEQFTTPTTPQAVDRRVDAAERAAFVERHLTGRIRGVRPGGLRSEACLYTLAPRSDFVIRPHDDNPGVLIVSACSGHGFKHSAAVGESLAGLLLHGRPHCDLSSFR